MSIRTHVSLFPGKDKLLPAPTEYLGVTSALQQGQL